MKKFQILLKSHCVLPDFEAEVFAESREDAAARIKEQYKWTLIEFDAKDLVEHIQEVT